MKNVYMQNANALGSSIELRLVADNLTMAEEWFSLLWKEISIFENSFSRFKTDSELSLFNERAGEKVEVSNMFKKLLEAAKKYSKLSDGLFNPFILPNLQRSGYLHSMDKTDVSSPDYSKRELAVHTSLEIGNTWARIPKNTALDMGGIGKGYLADSLAKILMSYTGDYCLSLGGDISIKGKNVENPWSIDIQSAENRSKNIASFTSVGNPFGIATSGIIREKSGLVQSHIINPQTGKPVPASNTICTVVADNVTTADVMASCILIAGRDLATRLVEQRTIKAALLQGKEYLKPLILGEGFSLNIN